MSKVSGYDFDRYKEAMVVRFGFSEQARDSSWHDLTIILRALETEPAQKFALTAGADDALHGLLLDTAGHYRFSEAVFGAGAVVVHDPFAYGTPEFEVAWQNTRAAFAAEGVDLPADYMAATPRPIADPRRAEACFLFVTQVADLRMAA